jgi:hypothetical protein
MISQVFPHGGPIDGYGCHSSRFKNEYHCHRGPLKDLKFKSKFDMLKKWREYEKGKFKPVKATPKPKSDTPPVQSMQVRNIAPKIDKNTIILKPNPILRQEIRAVANENNMSEEQLILLILEKALRVQYPTQTPQHKR